MATAVDAVLSRWAYVSAGAAVVAIPVEVETAGRGLATSLARRAALAPIT
jgi:hypothetical protein